ncbi:MAG TPA: hypothetical protein VH143_30980 [Kofleriaceae bacterium]|jgi:hypothetical protein|nr:hypothetical protein [Kofleriaceae bacterium]
MTDPLIAARFAFERDHDVARARELIDQAIAERDEPGRIAGYLVMIGDHARAEPFARDALAFELACDPIKPVIAGTRHLFLAKLLDALGNREAAVHAREGIAWYSKGVPSGDRELAFVSAGAERIIARYATAP